MAERKKKTISSKNIIVTAVIILTAGGFMLFTGSAPTVLREYIPPSLQSFFYPEINNQPKRSTSKISSTNEALAKEIDLPSTEGNTKIESFDKSKTLLKKMYVSARHFTEFYCGSTYDENFNLDHSKSGYHFRKDEKRGNRVEWEHIVAAESFGQSFSEWRDGHPSCVDSKGPYKGRKCAGKASKEFELMEADMYNLVPAIGEVNGDRSNYRFDMIPGEKREYGKCNMEIEDRIAEPPDNKFGDIARTYMYMEAAYHRGVIAQSNIKLFEAWDKLDPVDKWECERARLVEKIQGNKNMILAKACKKAGL